ncbi:MAG: hypothetical protein RIT45_1692 [Pseudomonadota bacterium]
MPQRIRVLAAVVRRGERLLLAQRPPHKRHGGLWEFPGGKVEPGETDAEAIARELREELDVTVVSTGAVRATHADPGSPYDVVFLEVAIDGEPRALEHAAVGFFTPTEAIAMALAPSDKRFLQSLPAIG